MRVCCERAQPHRASPAARFHRLPKFQCFNSCAVRSFHFCCLIYYSLDLPAAAFTPLVSYQKEAVLTFFVFANIICFFIYPFCVHIIKHPLFAGHFLLTQPLYS